MIIVAAEFFLSFSSMGETFSLLEKVLEAYHPRIQSPQNIYENFYYIYNKIPQYVYNYCKHFPIVKNLKILRGLRVLRGLFGNAITLIMQRSKVFDLI
jgi:hypothetical protein